VIVAFFLALQLELPVMDHLGDGPDLGLLLDDLPLEELLLQPSSHQLVHREVGGQLRTVQLLLLLAEV